MGELKDKAVEILEVMKSLQDGEERELDGLTAWLVREGVVGLYLGILINNRFPDFPKGDYYFVYDRELLNTAEDSTIIPVTVIKRSRPQQ